MKKYINKIIAVVLTITLVIGSQSCSNLVEGYERSPNSPTNADADQMVQGVQLSMNVAHQGEMARLAGIWSGYFTGADRQYIAYEDYALTAGDFNGGWGELYSGTIYNAQVLAEKATLEGNIQMVGMAKVCQAMSYGTMASLFGDIPMSQAGQISEYPNPVFDGQAAVYGQIQTLLNDAIADLGGAGSINNDLYFGGDAAAWIEVAHSLKARYFMMTKDYANAITEIGMGISSPANDLMGNTQSSFAYSVRDWNLFMQFTWWDREGYMTAEKAHLPSMLNASNALYRGDAKTNEGARSDYFYYAPGEYSPIDPNYYGFFFATESNAMLSYVEGQLTLAEAYSRSSDDANALIALNAARAAIFVQMDAWWPGNAQYDAYVLTDFDAGGMANIAGLTGSESLQMEIVEEKYVSMYGNIEVFVDLNRTNNQLSIPSRNSKEIPKRFLYPQSESNSNSSFPGFVGFDVALPVNN